MSRYFIIAGEASGDRHAAELIQALRRDDPEAVFCGMGGDLMRQAGCQLVQDYRQMAYMGFVAVLRNLSKIRRNLKLAKTTISEFSPDHLILIDYPSFNLQIAQYAKHHLPQTTITYYIPPKIWAWKKWRVHKIARNCDHILGIFPFEPAFYAQYGYEAKYVGNPTVEQIEQYKPQQQESKAPSIVLAPGSRQYEVEKCLPIMLKAAQPFAHQYNIVITQAPTLSDDFYTGITRQCDYQPILTRDTYQAISNATAAVVNSGTATLETALLKTPQVAVYHVEWSYILERLRPLLFTIPHFTLVNIIAGKQIIKELLGHYFTPQAVSEELSRLLTDQQYIETMQQGYTDIRNILGTNHAADTAAKIITTGKPQQ